MLNDIDELAKLQLIPADGAVAEASPGQFEINLHHTDNVLDACDDALALKRLVRLMAEKHKMHATLWRSLMKSMPAVGCISTSAC